MAAFALPGVAHAAESFAAWVERLWPDAQAAGISRATFERVFAGMTPNCQQPNVFCEDDSRQPVPSPGVRIRPTGLPPSCNKVPQKEFLQPDKYFPPDSLRRLALRGHDFLANLQAREPQTYRRVLDLQENFRVPLPVLMGLWGRETAFGEARLDYNTIQALASSAYAGVRSRRAWSRKQLLAALTMVDRRDVALADFRSSYAGATGLTQIMPTEYLSFAVDGDFDGRSDIWNSIVDSMATTANILKDRGWRGRQGSWGYEVMARGGRPLACTLEGSANRWPIRRWVQEYGLSPVPRRDASQPGFPNPDSFGYLLMPAGARGPVFLVNDNFDVLRRYNPAELYALYVGHLGDRIGCDTADTECGFRKSWPQPGPDDFAFTPENICRLQVALKERGFLTDQPDGLFGSQTRIAIGRYQASRSRQPDCYPTSSLFDELMAAPHAQVTQPGY